MLIDGDKSDDSKWKSGNDDEVPTCAEEDEDQSWGEGNEAKERDLLEEDNDEDGSNNFMPGDYTVKKE